MSAASLPLCRFPVFPFRDVVLNGDDGGDDDERPGAGG